MAAKVLVALSATEVAEAQRKARILGSQIAGRRRNAKVEVDAGTLKSLLKVIEAVAPEPARRGFSRTNTTQAAAALDEISPQEAADILHMSRPSIMRLIEKGRLHPRKVLSRNKLSRAEVLAYQQENLRQRREALENLTALAEAYDF